MTIEIPNTVELLPVVLLIAGLIMARMGDGPSVVMLLSAACFIASAVLFFC